jgi:hypothetical protein
VKYAGSNLIKHDAPVLATLQRGVKRTPLDLRCPSSLYIVFGCFQTRQQFGGEDSALIRLKLERLPQNTVCSVGHMVILLRGVSPSMVQTVCVRGAMWGHTPRISDSGRKFEGLSPASIGATSSISPYWQR